jgi:hypothetical protein
MASYYDSNKATSANSRYFILNGSEGQHFPFEGLYIGTLSGGEMELPALIDICEVRAFCMLYNNEETRSSVNHVLEKLAWRIAVTIPANLCDIILYNGGNAGDAFNTHSRLNKYLVGDRDERVLFDGNAEEFHRIVDEAYASIVQRMSAINCAGKRTLVELNESLGRDARMKYQFFILTDFPRSVRMQTVQKLSQIIETGSRAGIYVMMSWDMNADFIDAQNGSSSFDAQTMLKNMEILFPKDGTYYFRNSGHDEVLNRFKLTLDDAVIDPAEANTWATYINNVVDVAKKNARPSALKQDFALLENTPYEPVMSEISVTVGLDVNDKHPVTVRFNSGDYIHAFILGQSGSGKSVLLNNIISSAILKYSPEDLMLYLMDFKGVEFNRYRGVKHTKAVLVDNSDPQMTLEVLRELREENKTRVKLWQKESVSNIDGYNKKYPNRRLPQILFVADECQVMFKENVSNGTERLIQQEIAEILNIIATQGRSQGIHMLLATQQLDETDISGQILKNLTECFLLMSAPTDSDRLVPDSSDMTSRQMTGMACYYHKRELQSQVQTYYANDEELADAIESAQKKASNVPGNGEHYFCGSSLFYLDQNKNTITQSDYDCPIALVGQNIGINASATTLLLRNDFSENILIFGTNKEEQTAGVAMNALASLMLSYQQKGIACRFFVIDCLVQQNSKYKSLLADWNCKGLCKLVPRQESGGVLHNLVDDISNNTAQPTILAIIGQERFIEMKRKLSLQGLSSDTNEWSDIDDFDFDSFEPLPDIDIDESVVIPELTDEQKLQLQKMLEQDEPKVETSQPEEAEPREEQSLADKMTYPKALSYILDEGPLQGVHTILMVDKPGNILFEGDYDENDTDKFRHKIILRSENKFLQPMRFSQEIDVEALSDEEEHLRAYYYPEGDDPVLFTPYQMPDNDTI